MERGPVALFGAIVAVGLGPALWLGAQFGRFDVAPAGTPVPVSHTHAATSQLEGGGSGAGGRERVLVLGMPWPGGTSVQVFPQR